GVEKTELFLILNDVSFDEALEIVLKQANLKYDLQNDIYYVGKKGKTPPPPIPLPERNPVPLPLGTTGSTPSMAPIDIPNPAGKAQATFQASPPKVT
ncbi:STN domain-containing protein, partial [Acinetobacter baumannii]